MAKHIVCDVNNIKEGEGKIFEVNGKKIAVFNVNGEFYAIDNTCKHKGGPLGEGYLDGNIVTCPWHAWQYDVKTGENPVDPNIKVETYKVDVEKGKIKVEL